MSFCLEGFFLRRWQLNGRMDAFFDRDFLRELCKAFEYDF